MENRDLQRKRSNLVLHVGGGSSILQSKGEKFPPNKYRNYVGGAVAPYDCSDPVSLDFFFQGDVVYPEYLTDVNVTICPSDSNAQTDLDEGKYHCDDNPDILCPCKWNSRSYIYFGWALDEDIAMVPGVSPNDAAFDSVTPGGGVLALAPLLGTAISGGFAGWYMFMDDNMGEGTLLENVELVERDYSLDEYEPGNPHTIYRLREGIERFFITDINNPAASTMAQSELAIMTDEISIDVHEFNHIPGGSNVLYLDGHVEFIRYPGTWPVTKMYAAMTGI